MISVYFSNIAPPSVKNAVKPVSFSILCKI